MQQNRTNTKEGTHFCKALYSLQVFNHNGMPHVQKAQFLSSYIDILPTEVIKSTEPFFTQYIFQSEHKPEVICLCHS